ncbi:MAG: bifunctional nuclease domain-containing protein, partial [Anaerolineales bacterium]
RMRARARKSVPGLEDYDGGRVPPGFTLSEAQLSPEAVIEIRDLHALVHRAIEALPAEQQAAVRLHYLDGLTLEEIGVIAGSPLGTIKARLHRAREKLRAQLLRELEAAHPSTARPTAGRSAQDVLRKEQPKMIEVIVDKVVMRMPKPVGDGPKDDVLVPAPHSGAFPGQQIMYLHSEVAEFNLPAPHFGHRVVLLKEKAGERILPIWIGPWEADSIALQLAGTATPRPLAHDLTMRLLEAAHATIERVAVSRLHEEVFYATISVRAGAVVTEVDARPSDALGLALRANVPIFVAPEIMDGQSLAPDKVNEKLEASMAQPPVQWEWVAAPTPSVFQMPKRTSEK